MSPSAEVMPAWTLHVFNNLLYVTTGDRNAPVGYGVYKTDGVAPTTWQPVIMGGVYQTGNLLSPDVLSAQELTEPCMSERIVRRR